LVEGGDTRCRVNHEYKRICFFQRDKHLFFDLDLENVLAVGDETPGIDQVETFPRPFGNTILTVARHATDIIDDRLALFEQAVEKRTFPHIWPSYDGNCKSTHISCTRIPLNRFPYPSISAAP